MDKTIFYYMAGVPLLGIFAQWLAWRFRLPSILLLLAFGVLLGQFVNIDNIIDGLAREASNASASPASPPPTAPDTANQATTNSLRTAAPQFLFPIVSLSVAIILFEGGLTLRLNELKHAGTAVFRLVTVAVAITWILTAFAAHWLVGLDLKIAALLGAILTVTGPTVIGPLLRHIQPTRRVGSIAKWEGIVVDPVGAILAVLVFQAIAYETTAMAVGGVLLKTIVVACLLGLVTGFVLVQIVKRYWIPDFLQGVVFLTVALAVFAVSNHFQEESGLVTVTLLGVYLANQKQVSVKHVVEFKEHLVILLISCLFIVLGSRLKPEEMLNLGWDGILFLAAMIVVIRPVSVLLATVRSGLNIRERVFLACLAPRGIVAAAVTSVFALEILHYATNPDFAHVSQLADHAQKLVPLTFLVIVGTVAVYGLAAGPLARWLKLAESNPQGILFASAEPWVQEIAKLIQEEGFAVMLVDTRYRNIVDARMTGLPAECASILSEHVLEESDLGGIGRLLAMTSNDEVNTLATHEYIHVFGREKVYQLPPWDTGAGQRQSIGEHLGGRQLFGEGLHHDKIANLMTHSMQLKKTKLTEEFNYEKFQETHGEPAVVLFVIDESKNLKIATVDDPLSPKSGQTVIALVNRKKDNGEEES